MKSNYVLFSKWFLIAAVGLSVAVIYWLGYGSPFSERHRSAAVVENSPNIEQFFRYTAPIKLSRLSNEWEPQKALILSLSLTEVMGNFDVARYHINLLEVAHPYLEVYVFCDYEKTRALAYFLSLIKRHPKGDAMLEKTHFIDSRPLMKWTRDFGPVFGLKRNNQLVAIDFVYRNLLKEIKGFEPKEGDGLRDFLALQGDAMPADVVAALQVDFEIAIDVVRPPISMDGGDFVNDGRGNVFVSTNTLARNGGNKEELESLFKRYCGAKKLHVMEALPGATVRHLDMILKFVDFETVILPDFQDGPESQINPYRIELDRKTRSVLDKNERYIRKNFPKYRILKIPMPPILFANKQEIITQAKQEFIKVVALERGLLGKDKIETLNSGELVGLEKQVVGLIKQETPSAKFNTIEGFNAVLREYGQMSLDDFVDLDAESVTRYRSYINSIFINSKEEGQAFIIPRFTSRDPDEIARLKEWEASTEKTYRAVWPQANIHWVNCDTMVSDMGFLHCTTITVPSAPFD